MSAKPEASEQKRPGYVIATEVVVDMFLEDLRDPKNQGPNWDEKIWPIGALVAAFIRGDEIIAASEEDIVKAMAIAEERWAKAWGLPVNDLIPADTT